MSWKRLRENTTRKICMKASYKSYYLCSLWNNKFKASTNILVNDHKYLFPEYGILNARAYSIAIHIGSRSKKSTLFYWDKCSSRLRGRAQQLSCIELGRIARHSYDKFPNGQSPNSRLHANVSRWDNAFLFPHDVHGVNLMPFLTSNDTSWPRPL